MNNENNNKINNHNKISYGMENKILKTYIFHVQGMHCSSCSILIESELKDLPEITSVKPSLSNNSVEITGDFGDKAPEHIARDLSVILKPHGYSLLLEKQKHQANWSDFKIALPIAIAFIAFFILLQKLGLVNLINASEVSYGTAFMIGLIASVSSCMAVVGGLVLSMSANFAKEGDKVRPQALFHLGRLVSFFLLGGLIGLVGSSFQLGNTGVFILSFLVALVLLILGLNLLDIFPWLKKLQPTIPSFIGKKFHGVKNLNHTLTPLLVGIITFFLPCGFTQSMQIYALSTGSFWTGSLIMFSFALGTLPVLALLSFSSLGIHKKAQSSIFFKTAGLVVIFFGIFNLINSLTLIGITPQKFFSSDISTTTTNIIIPEKIDSTSNVTIENGVQVVTLQTKGGYSPRKSVAQAGLPTVVRFSTNGTFDCSLSVRIPSLNLNKILPQTGLTDISLGTSTPGLFRGSCGMGMYPFEIDFQ